MKRLAALLVAVAVSMPAAAFLEPPTVVPADPVAGENVSIAIFGGDCDYFDDLPGSLHVTRNGALVHVVIDGIHVNDPMACARDDVGTWLFPIGVFDPGTYTLDATF